MATLRQQLQTQVSEVYRLKTENAALSREVRRLHFYEELFERLKGTNLSPKIVDDFIAAILSGRHFVPKDTP